MEEAHRRSPGRSIRDIRRATDGDKGLEQAFAVPLGRGSRKSPARSSAGAAGNSIPGTPRRPSASAREKPARPRRQGLAGDHQHTGQGRPLRGLTRRHWRHGSTASILHATALPGNPHGGHILADMLGETPALTGREIDRVHVDKSYRGRDAPNPWRVFKSGHERGVHGQIKKELGRRSSIEANIGHRKTDGHLGRNFPKGRLGDRINTVMSAVGYNQRLILKWPRIFLRKITAAILLAMPPPSALKAAS